MSCCIGVPTQSTGILERWGRFVELLQPGLTCFWPCCESVAIVRNNIQQATHKTNTKTNDDVNLTIVTAVQYTVKSENSRKAHYELQAPVQQLQSHIDNCIRSHVPGMSMDEVFRTKDSISSAVKLDLEHKFERYGYDIVSTLVTDIILPPNIVAAMNSKVENHNIRLATTEKSEAYKISIAAEADATANKMRKLAEAQAEVDMLKGRGLAQQRMEIVRGLNDAVQSMSGNLKIDPTRTIDAVMTVQYYDMLEKVGSHAKAIMVPYSSNPTDLIRNAMVQSHQVMSTEKTERTEKSEKAE